VTIWKPVSVLFKEWQNELTESYSFPKQGKVTLQLLYLIKCERFLRFNSPNLSQSYIREAERTVRQFKLDSRVRKGEDSKINLAPSKRKNPSSPMINRHSVPLMDLTNDNISPREVVLNSNLMNLEDMVAKENKQSNNNLDIQPQCIGPVCGVPAIVPVINSNMSNINEEHMEENCYDDITGLLGDEFDYFNFVVNRGN